MMRPDKAETLVDLARTDQKYRIVLVHGFNVKDGGAQTVDQLEPHLTELGHSCDLDSADYGYWSLLKIYFGGKRGIVRRLMKAFEFADIIITHSNGANFSNLALEQMDPREGDRPRLLVHFSPALNRKTPIPFSVDHQFVYHSSRDYIVRLSTWLPFLPWGRMGARGYKGDGPNTNIDRSGKIAGHSTWFHGDNAKTYSHSVVAHVNHHIARNP